MMSAPTTVQALAGRIPQMVDELRTLVELESPSASQVATACADALAQLGEQHLGLPPEVLDHDGVRHLLWRGPGDPAVLVLGHYDTVWPEGTIVDRPFEVDGDTARGPGTFDMKAGLVQVLHGLSRVGMDGVVLLMNGDEEIGSPTSERLIASLAGEVSAALVAEPSAPGGALKTSRKGTIQVRLTLRGRASHAGLEPQAGISTTMALTGVLPAAAALADAGLDTTVTPTTVRSGSASNAVPDEATIDVDVRAWSRRELDRVWDGLQSLRRGELLGLQAVARYRRDPYEPASSEALFALIQQVAERSGLAPMTGLAVGGCSDGNITSGVGTPTLDGLGPVGAGAHAVDEFVVVSEMPRRAALLGDLVGALRHGKGMPDE